MALSRSNNSKVVFPTDLFIISRMHETFKPNHLIIYLSRLLQYQPPVAPLRTKFIYSNYFYALAGYAAELMTGQTWEELVDKYLFKPLQMNSSGFVDHIKTFDQFALGYSYLKEKPVKLNEELLQ